MQKKLNIQVLCTGEKVFNGLRYILKISEGKHQLVVKMTPFGNQFEATTDTTTWNELVGKFPKLNRNYIPPALIQKAEEVYNKHKIAC